MMTATAMQGYPLRELLSGIVDVPAAANRLITGLSIDTRTLKPGDCFIALRGHHAHGFDFADVAITAGAVAIITEPGTAREIQWRRGVPVLPVPDLNARCSALAARYFDDPSAKLTVIGVTGTNGKTSTSHVLAQSLQETSFGPCGLVGTLGYGLLPRLAPPATTTPDAVAVQSLLDGFEQAQARSAVLEVSSHALVQHRVAAVKFRLAIFTNLSRDHLDYHADMQDYALAKRRLFESADVRTAVVNLDDPYSPDIVAAIRPEVGILGYALSGIDKTPAGVTLVAARSVSIDRSGISMTVDAAGAEVRVCSRLLGRYNASNLLAALAALIGIGVPARGAADALAAVAPVPGRMQLAGASASEPFVIVDYAHSPDALRAALESLREITAGRIICVFGCGGERDRGKRPMMGAIAAQLADRIILTNDNPRREDPKAILEEILQGIPAGTETLVIPDRPTAIHEAVRLARTADAVLLAGKGHESHQDLGDRVVAMNDCDLADAALQAWRK
jgi:UDP-N-acetylmuramoyl-L-alanyl-D-glutamate--2,6-diaminopimelate ligase